MRNQNQTKIFIILSVLLLTMILVGSVHAATKMPSFNLPDATNGKSVASGEFAGKTLLVTFFATWCPPCMQEIPTLIQLQNELGAKGFSVLALSVDQGGASVVKRLIDKRSINYPVLMADAGVARSFGGVVGIPTSFLIDKEGNVVKKYPGYVPHAILESDINRIMK